MGCLGKISAGIVNDCDNLPVAGVKTKAWIMNTEDIDRAGIGYDATNPLIINAMSMLGTAKAFEIEVLEDTMYGEYSNVAKDFGPNYFKHMVGIIITDYKNMTKKEIKDLNNAKVTIVLENMKDDQDTVLEVYGLGSGLKMTELKRNTKDAQASVSVVLSSKDGQEEPNIPYSIWNTDYATSKAIVEALVV